MANVKITDLTALSGDNVASNDVLPIVDINNDQTKKIAISDLITATSAANDFITFTQLNANLNVLDANADAIEARRVANVSVMTTEDTALQTRLTTNVTAFTAEDVRLNANINVVQDNVTAVEARRVANVTVMTDEDTALQARLTTNVTTFTNEDTALQARLTTNVTTFTNEDTALQARLTTNVTAFTNEDTALQARIAANTLAAASNDFITFTRLNANINVVQDNVASVTVGTAADTETRLNANLNVVSDNAAGVETRRVANIAGAISTVTTSDLTASRAMVTNGSGKIAISDITATELGYLDDVSGSIQTQLDAKAPLAGATFTGQVNMNDDLVVTGNLVVNGDTTTANSVNLIVQDRMIMLANSVTGAPSADVGFLFNRGNQGNAAFFYDESASTFKLSDTKDPSSNTSLSPVTASNLDVGIVTAASVVGTAITQNGATLDNLIGSNVDGAISTVNDTNLTVSRALVSDGSGKIAVSDVSSTELGHLDGVTSAIQTQFTAAETRRTNNIAGAVSTITTSDLTASRALVSGSGGKVEVSAITSTELGHLDGIGQNINSNLAALAAGIAASGTTDFPTGDYGLLDAANASVDDFGITVVEVTQFDMKTDPAGSLATEDLGALS